MFFFLYFFRFMSFNVQSIQKKKRRNKHHNHKCIAFCQILFTSFKFNKNKINKWKSNQTINCFPFLSETNGFFQNQFSQLLKSASTSTLLTKLIQQFLTQLVMNFWTIVYLKLTLNVCLQKKTVIFFHHLRFILIV